MLGKGDEAMAETVVREIFSPGDFVTRDAFDIHVRSMRDRASSEEKLSDARFDKLEVLMERNRAEQKELLTGFVGRIDSALTQIKKDVDRNTSDIQGMAQDIHELYESVSAMRGDVKAVSARLDTQQVKIGWLLTFFGLVITVAVAVIQVWR